ncbi:hypothetical protein JTB14_031555 [Gonioctena quinquepunctata]|nr:hypothetical protein JTB14_031555 [Gonioctena quinquepunctata]
MKEQREVQASVVEAARSSVKIEEDVHFSRSPGGSRGRSSSAASRTGYAYQRKAHPSGSASWNSTNSPPNSSADNYTDNYQEYQYSTNDNYTDDYQDSQNFGAESYTDNYQEYQSNISDHTNDQYDFGYSETQPNQYENFQDFPIGPISFDPPINQSIDPTSELRAQVQALNISDNLNPNLNFPEQMFL